MKTVLYILGMHRSGTSAVTGTINRMGLDIGSDLMPITQDNPKGYYENNKVLKLNEKILIENNSSWDNCHFKISKIPKEKIAPYVAEAKKILTEEFRYSEQFCIKDPRNCITFPIWEQASLELKYTIKIIIPHRNPIEVANSLKKRDSFSFEKSLTLWCHHFLSAEHFSRPYKRIFLSFNELLNDTKKTVKTLNDFIGIESKGKETKQIESFLDVNIKNNNLSIENITDETPSFLQKLFRLLKESDFSNIRAIDKIRNDFYYSLEMFHFSEVLESIQQEKNQTVEIEALQKTVGLLEGVSDPTQLDQKFYIQKYPDLEGFEEDKLEEHYFNHGKQEERIPNQYCEFFKIDAKDLTSNREIIYFQNIKIEQYNQEIFTLKNNMTSLLEEIKTLKQQQIEIEKSSLKNKNEYEKQLEQNYEKTISLNNELNLSLEEIRDLKLQLIATKKSTSKIKQKNEKIISLNNKLQQSLDEIRTLKKQLSINKLSSNSIKDVEKQLQKSKQDLTLLNEKLKKSLDNFAFLEQQKAEIDRSLTEAFQDIENKDQNIIALQEKNASLNQKIQIENTKYLELDLEFNEAIEEIARIKECGCWVYTKPIRILKEKLTKGK